MKLGHTIAQTPIPQNAQIITVMPIVILVITLNRFCALKSILIVKRVFCIDKNEFKNSKAALAQIIFISIGSL